MTDQTSRFNSVDNTGFGPNSSVEGLRLTNKDGSINLRKAGVPFYERISIYHTLLKMPRAKFLLLVLAFYTTLNVFFAFLYFFIGVDKLYGSEVAKTWIDKYLIAFFFSSQTLTTVGYGHISPVGLTANALASLESLIGILSFALVTGIFYARFARPKAYIKFSDNLLVAPYKDGRALMFRLATSKNNHLSDVEAQVTAAIHLVEDGKIQTRFFQLPLEMKRINSLALSWTIVHPLDEHSPLGTFNKSDFLNAQIEIMVTIKAFDDHFSNTVQQRTSYTHDDLIYGAKFIPMFARSENGKHTVLYLDRVNAHEEVVIQEPEKFNELGRS